jgi:hypothetical protein
MSALRETAAASSDDGLAQPERAAPADDRGPGGSAEAAEDYHAGMSEEQGGWLARVPLWARIVGPVIALIALVATIMLSIPVASQPADPAEIAEACREAAQEQLDSLDRAEADVSETFEVTDEGGEYRVQGSATYVDENGDTQHGAVRCVVRVVDGTPQVRSVRFGF